MLISKSSFSYIKLLFPPADKNTKVKETVDMKYTSTDVINPRDPNPVTMHKKLVTKTMQM